MDLLEKVAIVVIVLIVIFSAGFLLFQHFQQTANLTSAQAVQYVLSDIKDANPGANITVINVSNSTQKGSYNIVLSVVYNSTKPCPTLLIDDFDYPAFGLSQSVDNTYTNKCIIYGPANVSSGITSPQIAIVKSYNQTSTPSIIDYVSKYGYSNTNVYAKYYSYLNESYTHLGQSYYNVWLVAYKASNANYSIYAVVDSSGAIAGNYTVGNNSSTNSTT